MTRIVVVGSSCAGKTTLAAAAAARAGLRHVELDEHHWGPDWTELPDAQMAESVDAATQGDDWITDGNYGCVRAVLWPKADTVVWLDYGFLRVFSRAVRRTVDRVVFRRRIFAGNRESFRRSFLSHDSILLWVIMTHGDRHRRYGEMLGDGAGRSPHLAPGVTIHRFRHPAAAEQWLAELAEAAAPTSALRSIAAARSRLRVMVEPTDPSSGSGSREPDAEPDAEAERDPHAGRRRCLACDYPLDQLDDTVCPECGRAFDPDDARTYLYEMPDRVALFRTHVLAAHALQFSLVADGIDAVVEEDPNPMLGTVGTVWVAREDADRAAQVLARSSGGPGSDAAAAEAGPSWTCEACAETVDPQFTACWKCGAARPAG